MKFFLEKILSGKYLTESESYTLIHEMTNNSSNHAQTGALMTGLLMRPLNINEIAGFRKALLDLCTPLSCKEIVMDVCGTGGDGKNTFNISTTASFVLAAAGIKIAKHGNYGVSSNSGSSNVLEALGLEFPKTNERFNAEIEKKGISFIHAPLFHPALKQVSEARKGLGVKNIFNLLGPLVNPAKPAMQISGTFNPELARIYYNILLRDEKKFAVVFSFDGYDEISLTGPFRLFSDKGVQTLYPEDLGIKPIDPQKIYNLGGAESSAKTLIQILSGEAEKEKTYVTAANAAMGIAIAKDLPIKDAFQCALEIISSGKAIEKLYQSVTKNLQHA